MSSAAAPEPLANSALRVRDRAGLVAFWQATLAGDLLWSDDARDLLTGAFASELLETLPVPGLADALADLLRERLRHARQEEAR